MLSRDSLRYLRALRKPSSSHYVCPFCTTRGQIKRSASSLPPLASSERRVKTSVRPNRAFSCIGPVQQQPDTSSSTRVSLDGSLINPTAVDLGSSKNVRDYLRRWSTENQKALEEHPFDGTLAGRDIVLSNNLFARKVSESPDAVADEDELFNSVDFGQYSDEDSVYNLDPLKPGEAFWLRKRYLQRQWAVYLGRVGHQGRFFLENGSWFVDSQAMHLGHRIPNFASAEEMAKINALIPDTVIELPDANVSREDYLRKASAEVPFHLSAGILKRFHTLEQEVEEYRRLYSDRLDDVYEQEAEEGIEYRTVSLHKLIRKHFHTDISDLSHAAMFVIQEKLHNDEKFVPLPVRKSLSILFVPKRIIRDGHTVIEWARAYQESAARAATGKDVSAELQKNPLTPFISKARRLITKSRKIRTPIPDQSLLSPTMKHARPASTLIERRPTGEEFSEDDKKIIELMYHTHTRRPDSPKQAIGRRESACSLILRAVGAYPNYALDRNAERVFLEELGCMDPWSQNSEHLVTYPIPQLGLNHEARVFQEQEQAIAGEMNLPPRGSLRPPPFPDSMAHLRKDWGDMEAFCIDSLTTVLVDDAISVEASQEFPDHHWFHVHIAHPSAFVPCDHPILERGRYMGSSVYGRWGSMPMMPFGLLESMSISSKRPSPVLTCSTLLSPDGTVKDIQITPGLLRNVIKIDKHTFASINDPTDKNYSILVSQRPQDKQHPHFSARVLGPASNQEVKQQKDLIARHRSTFDLIQRLLVARWDARQRENSPYLKLRELPSTSSGIPLLDFGDLSLQSCLFDYDRLFRSEHCYGDPSIRITAGDLGWTPESTFDVNPSKHNHVVGASLLVSESTALWCKRHDVPVMYRMQKPTPGYSIEKLNTLGKYEGYIAPESGQTLYPSPMVYMNLAQGMQCTNPLRRFNDFINMSQIDAYLKAEAVHKSRAGSDVVLPDYPYNRDDLMRLMTDFSRGWVKLSSTVEMRGWTIYALWRAFYFEEGKLPDVWDLMMPNPVVVGKAFSRPHGILMPFALPAEISPSEQAYETSAKFRQFLPVKIIRINWFQLEIEVVAVGPATDERSMQDTEIESGHSV